MLTKFRLSIYALVISLTVLAVGLSLTFNRTVMAASQPAAVAQGYIAQTPLQPGMIVRLDTNNPNEVVPLDQSSINQMLGVVVSASDSAITIGRSGGSQQQVYVTNFGQHNVLVSTQNGPIKVGDYITISSISGIGMKANSSQSLVLGQAAANFNNQSNVLSSASLTSSSGNKTTVELGSIPVDISIANNPLAVGPQGLPSFLKKITKFATNKSVSATRVYLSMLIVIIGAVVTITVIYAGVKNGIISLGRNPLAKKVISGGLVRLVLAAIIIFAISLGVAYAVLL